ncbi:MAG: hypothetical protein AAB263_22160 [Planctomycetota bacterium]
MTRAVFAIACCCIAAATAALETPLTVAQGNRMVLIDAAYGAITTYEITANTSNRMGLGKASANFIADIELWSRKPVNLPSTGVPIVALRTGGENNKPNYRQMFLNGTFFSERPTAADVAAGRPSASARAVRAEDAFWKAAPLYDGVVRVAISGDGKYLAVAVQALHALLVYQLENDIATLAAVRNWGPELLIQVGYNTSPSPFDLMKMVTPDKQKDILKLVGLDNQAPPTGTPPPAATDVEEPPTPKSEVWIGAGPNDGFLVVDTANQRAMLYQITGRMLELRSVRNLNIDLLIPALMPEPNTGAWQSNPAGGMMLREFLRSRESQLRALNLPTEKDDMLLFVGQHAAKGGHASAFEALFQPGDSGVALLNFANRHTFLTVDTKGSQMITLVAMRDYSLDLAVSMLDQVIQDRKNALAQLNEAKQYASSRQAPLAFMAARLALSLNPRLHKDLETGLKNAFREPALQAEFQTILDAATVKAAELDKMDEARKKSLDELRKKAPAK